MQGFWDINLSSQQQLPASLFSDPSFSSKYFLYFLEVLTTCSLTHSLTHYHSLTHSLPLTHYLHQLTHQLTHYDWLYHHTHYHSTHSLTHSLTSHQLTHPFTYSPTHSPTDCIFVTGQVLQSTKPPARCQPCLCESCCYHQLLTLVCLSVCLHRPTVDCLLYWCTKTRS